MATTLTSITSGVPSGPEGEPVSPGRRLLSAIASRDFAAVGRLLATDVWFRALLPRHLGEHRGAEATLEAFRSWYGDVHAAEVLALDHHRIASKEKITYRFLVRPDWAPATWHLIEQTAVLSVSHGTIRKIDLVCSGFLPLDDAEVRAARGGGMASPPPR